MTIEEEQDAANREAAAALARGDMEAATQASRKSVPLQARMGVRFIEAGEQKAVLTMELTNEVRGAASGSVHGGVLATFADIASAASLVGTYEIGVDIPVTTDLHVRYYRQPASGPLTAEATVVHRGRRLLSTECSVTDASQRVLIRSTATYMVVPRPV